MNHQLEAKNKAKFIEISKIQAMESRTDKQIKEILEDFEKVRLVPPVASGAVRGVD